MLGSREGRHPNIERVCQQKQKQGGRMELKWGQYNLKSKLNKKYWCSAKKM